MHAVGTEPASFQLQGHTCVPSVSIAVGHLGWLSPAIRGSREVPTHHGARHEGPNVDPPTLFVRSHNPRSRNLLAHAILRGRGASPSGVKILIEPIARCNRDPGEDRYVMRRARVCGCQPGFWAITAPPPKNGFGGSLSAPCSISVRPNL